MTNHQPKKMPPEQVSPIQVGTMNGQSLSVHLEYIRRDVDELKASQVRQHNEVIQKLNDIQALYPTRKEFEEVIMGMQKLVADHETRVRTIEKSMWKWTGVASAVGVVASLIVQLILKF